MARIAKSTFVVSSCQSHFVAVAISRLLRREHLWYEFFMKIQWSTYQEVQQRTKHPLQECLKTYATPQSLHSAFGKEPESLILPPNVETELVWSGRDESGVPLIFRSVTAWPRAQVSLWTYLPINAEGLFPWAELAKYRAFLPSYFFSKTLFIGEAFFFGAGFAVLREELSGQPWTVYKTPSKRDAEGLIEFLQSFGEASYQLFEIDSQEHRFILAVEDAEGGFHVFETYPEDTPRELLQQRIEMFAPKWPERRVCIFADRVGGEVVVRK